MIGLYVISNHLTPYVYQSDENDSGEEYTIYKLLDIEDDKVLKKYHVLYSNDYLLFCQVNS